VSPKNDLIILASNNIFAGCTVTLNVNGYNQLYTNTDDRNHPSIFAGNYVIGLQDENLRYELRRLLSNGDCRQATYTQNSPMVLKAANNGFAGCTVTLNVDGYNQVYTQVEQNNPGGLFSGNYVIGLEDQRLEDRLASLVASGDCRELAYAGTSIPQARSQTQRPQPQAQLPQQRSPRPQFQPASNNSPAPSQGDSGGSCSTYASKRFNFSGNVGAFVIKECADAGGSLFGECTDNVHTDSSGYVTTYFTKRQYFYGSFLAEAVANCNTGGGSLFGECTDHARCD
jgi:hypothetical protein